MKTKAIVLLLFLALAGTGMIWAEESGVDEDALFGGSSNDVDEDALFGEETDSGIDEDALFGDSSDTDDDPLFSGSSSDEASNETGDGDDEFSMVITDMRNSDTTYKESFLSSDKIKIGGSYNASVGSGWGWTEYPESWDDFAEKGDEGLSVDLGASLYFSARPNENFRVYGKVKTDLPLMFGITEQGLETTSGNIIPGDNNSPAFLNSATLVDGTTIPIPNLEIFELFSDFNWDNVAFFRVGKQTINWGVGYFFSPANVINIGKIDINDPEAQLEGPIAIKANIPFGMHNADMYVLAGPSIESILDMGVAARGTFLIGNYELGVGVAYQRDSPVKGIATFSGAFWEINTFAEIMVSYGSDQKFLELNDNVWSTVEKNDDFFFSATAGGMYNNSDIDMSIMAQYYFNGYGYSDPDNVKNFYTDYKNNPFLPMLMDPENPVKAMEEAMGATVMRGQHYAILRIGFSDIADSGVSATVLTQANLGDLSGLVTTTVSYKLFDYATLSGSLHTAFGEEGDEYMGTIINQGGEEMNTAFMNRYGRFGLSFSVSLGGGTF